MSANRTARQPAGSPVGGQFAPTGAAEAESSLSPVAQRHVAEARRRRRRAAATVVIATEHPTLAYAVHGDDAEEIDVSGNGAAESISVHPGTAADLAAMDWLEYAPAGDWGEPGWHHSSGSTAISTDAEDQFSIFAQAPGRSHEVRIRFQGVKQARAVILALIDAAALAVESTNFPGRR